jgi:hypothetical protein
MPYTTATPKKKWSSLADTNPRTIRAMEKSSSVARGQLE